MMDAAPPAAVPAAAHETLADRVVVTARRADRRSTLNADLVSLRPVYRIGERLEAVPGRLVLAHSGETKVNQDVMRGEDLDHGADLALFVDGAPVNRPANAHGQRATRT